MTAWAPAVVQAAALQGVRMHEAPDSTRVVFDISHKVQYKIFTLENPHRVVVDLQSVAPKAGFDPSVVAVGRQRVHSLRAAPRGGDYRVVQGLDRDRVVDTHAGGHHARHHERGALDADLVLFRGPDAQFCSGVRKAVEGINGSISQMTIRSTPG